MLMRKETALSFLLAILLTAPCLATTRDGSKDVTTAGTRVALVAAQEFAAWVTVQAKTGNTGSIYLGGVTIDSTRGIELLSGDTHTFLAERARQYDLNGIYIDSSVNGEGVTFTYESR